MFRDNNYESGNRYDTHIKMYPAPSVTEAPRRNSPVGSRMAEAVAPYPIEDVNELINPVPMFNSTAPKFGRPPVSNSPLGDGGSESINSDERYDIPFQIPRNSGSSHSITTSHEERHPIINATDVKEASPIMRLPDGSNTRTAVERIPQPPPPPYEESEVRILQEKAYRTQADEVEPLRKISKEEVAPPEKDLSQYSASALAFYQIYARTVADSTSFTPEIQLKWCETLLEYASNDEFLARYNINAERLKRELRPEEKLKNQKVILEHSFKVLTKLISLKYGPAMYLMATLYSHQPYLKIKNKKIVVRNDKKALEYYCRASKCNHSDACYRAGVSYEFQRGVSREEMSREQSLQKAFQYYERGAQLCNNSSCMYKLGMFHLYGEDPKNSNPIKAIEWFKKAGKMGDSPQSLYELGKIYEHTCLPEHIQSLLIRNDVQRSPSKALKYYYKCATDSDYPLAQWKLGHCYEFGDLQLPVVAKKSIAWYAKASLAEPKGNAMAMLSLSGWYLTGASKVLKPNDTEAFKWAQKSCQASDGKFGRAEYALGYYYEKGIGCQPDLQSALGHYQKAAKTGHPKAMERLQNQ